jgi:hypothetical protein
LQRRVVERCSYRQTTDAAGRNHCGARPTSGFHLNPVGAPQWRRFGLDGELHHVRSRHFRFDLFIGGEPTDGEFIGDEATAEAYTAKAGT